MPRTSTRDPGARGPRARGPGAPSLKSPTLTLTPPVRRLLALALYGLGAEHADAAALLAYSSVAAYLRDVLRAHNHRRAPKATPRPGSSGAQALAERAAHVIARELRAAAAREGGRHG